MFTLAIAFALDAIKLEAEDAQLLDGVVKSSQRQGFSGFGYASGFTAPKAALRWKVPVAAPGIYTVEVRYAAESEKGIGVYANGSETSAMLKPSSGWKIATLGLIELRKGENEVGINRGWGWYEIDWIRLSKAPEAAAVRPVPAVLANRKAGQPARNLFKRLAGLYGHKTMTGQYGESENQFVEEKTGALPAVYGDDFMDYSPSRAQRGAKPTGVVEKSIRRFKMGQIPTISWHWNAPSGLLDKKFKDSQGREVDASWYKGFYSNATTFDLSKAMANPASEERRLLVRDMDVVAKELLKLKKAGVPVLWRPLHEAEGGWFWWGAKGPKPCLWLWKFMFERYSKVHGLDNLIWVWNSTKPDWYPDDNLVDIVAVDQYPSDRRDPLSATWEPLLAQFNGRKMLAVAEFPGAMDVDRSWKFGVKWLYSVGWVGDLGPRGNQPAVLRAAYSSPRSVSVRTRFKGR